jgi:hypothetical protein
MHINLVKNNLHMNDTYIDVYKPIFETLQGSKHQIATHTQYKNRLNPAYQALLIKTHNTIGRITDHRGVST